MEVLSGSLLLYSWTWHVQCKGSYTERDADSNVSDSCGCLLEDTVRHECSRLRMSLGEDVLMF